MLRLLHLSDIHFRGYSYPWDDDEDQRRELVRAVKGDVAVAGPIDGILIGGDIAFSGKAKEYRDAARWLDELIIAAQCSEGSVWMVPGNHDVDLAIADPSPIIQGYFVALRTCDVEQISDELHNRLFRDPASDALVAPLQAYNEFARPRGCSTSANTPHWYDQLDIGGMPILLWGINSVLVSDRSDGGPPDADPTLVLGEQQCKVPRLDGHIRIVLCHHPPGWIRDWKVVESYLSRAHIVLFGHEHTASVQQSYEGGTVHVHAGAVGPERDGNWAPTFNVLTLSYEGDRIRLSVEPNHWDADHTEFVRSDDGPQVRFIDIETSRRADTDNSESESDSDVTPAAATPLIDQSERAADEARPEQGAHLRDLVYRYLSLPPFRRIELAQQLQVFDGVDLDGEDPYGEILRRVRDSGQLQTLEQELS